jgi:hypothetical protein
MLLVMLSALKSSNCRREYLEISGIEILAEIYMET